MGGIHVHAFFGFSIYPAAKTAAARENKRVYTIGVDDCQFKVSLRRRSQDWPPTLFILFIGSWFRHGKTVPRRSVGVPCRRIFDLRQQGDRLSATF